MNRLQVSEGEQFGRLTIVREVDPPTIYAYRSIRRFLCSCSCGSTKTVRLDRLRSGSTKSCGCLLLEIVSMPGRGEKHGLYSHPLYKTWLDARRRCTDPKNKSFINYGGRGITMYEEWLDNPTGFIDYIETNLGSRPDGFTIDRINNDQGYEPGNLRWATLSEQRRNQRPRRLTPDQVSSIRQRLSRGERQLLIAQDFGVGQATVSRISTNTSHKEENLDG